MDIVERLRSGHQYSGVVDSLDIEAAAEIERLTRERDALRAAVLGLLEYWHEDDMDQEYYEIAEKQALAALEQSAPEPTKEQIETAKAIAEEERNLWRS